MHSLLAMRMTWDESDPFGNEDFEDDKTVIDVIAQSNTC